MPFLYDSLIRDYGFEESDIIDYEVTPTAEIYTLVNESGYMYLEIYEPFYSILLNNYYVLTDKEIPCNLRQNSL